MKEVVGLGPRNGVEPHLCFQDLTQDLTIFPVDNARPVEFYNHQARIVERQYIAWLKILAQITKAAVLDFSRYAMEHEEAGSVAPRGRGLGD